MSAAVPFFDRTRGDAAIEAELTEAFLRVVRSGRYIFGPEVEAFEREAAARLGAPHAIGVSCGTDALVLSLLALGVGPGDEVICPAYTFFATAGAVARVGATPVLVDVEPDRLTLDPEAARARLGPRTRALLPVHLYGDVADLDALGALGPPVVEDAAQAFGATFDGGHAAGTRGALGCFSFFPTKNLGGFGDGGLVVTAAPALAARVRSLRVHGSGKKHEHAEVGGNYRLDALQAALLAVRLRHLDDGLRARRAHAARYAELLAGVGPLVPLTPTAGASFNQYVVRVPGEGVRDRLRDHLAAQGVGTEVYYPRPLHLQPALAHLGHAPGAFPHAEAAARETLALPIFPELRDEELVRVAEAIACFFR